MEWVDQDKAFHHAIYELPLPKESLLRIGITDIDARNGVDKEVIITNLPNVIVKQSIDKKKIKILQMNIIKSFQILL